MFDLSKIVNAILMSDSYKNSHYGFSPKGLTEIYSNGTPRFDYYFKEKYPDFDMNIFFDEMIHETCD